MQRRFLRRLTPTKLRGSVEIIEMKNAAHTRARGFLAKAVSLLTLAGLVVAPACAPICAAQACSQAPLAAGTESHCHFSETTNDHAGHIHGVQSCGAPQLQMANLTSVNRRGALQWDRATISANAAGLLSLALSLPHPCSVRGARIRLPQSFGSPIPTAVLRI